MGATTKVKFFDEHREHYIFENAALRSKLQSKVEAVTIMSKELDKCRSERDQLKLVAEQLQQRFALLKKKQTGSCYYDDMNDYSQMTGGNVAKLLADTRETNKVLRLEVETLRQKLSEVNGDVEILRMQLNQQRFSNNIYKEAQLFPTHQREELVEQLEKCEMKITQLQADLQSVLDEKEEIVKERDAFKCKVHRLNHELGILLKVEHGSIVDGDALITENKYLHERLQQAESETKLVTQALIKYKGILGSKRQQNPQNSGSTDLIMSHKQVGQFLKDGRPPVDLKPLCLGLLEALNDKSIALAHQRKANKILAERLTELEDRLEKQKGVSIFPSRTLLCNYSSADVDHQLCDDDKTSENTEITIKSTEEASACQENTSSDANLANNSEDTLPPQLQRLVDQALRELEG